MTPERLNELQALCDAASPAPWGTVENSVPSPAILLQFEWNEADQEWDRNVGKINGVPDAAFIAAARTALPELIARVRELEADNDRLRYEIRLCSGSCRADRTEPLTDERPMT